MQMYARRYQCWAKLLVAGSAIPNLVKSIALYKLGESPYGLVSKSGPFVYYLMIGAG